MDTPLMKEQRDCHVPAVALVANVTYSQAKAALWHRDLRSILTSIIFSNPWNLLRALWSLGRSTEVSRKWEPENWRPYRTILLVHNPGNFFDKHWVVLGEPTDRGVSVYWGDSKVPRRFTWGGLEELVAPSGHFVGWPLYAITVREQEVTDDDLSVAPGALEGAQ